MISNSGFEVRQRLRRRRRGRAATCGQQIASKGVTGRDERRHRMSHGGAKSCHALEFVSTASRPACESRVWIGWMGLLAGCWWPITGQLTRARWGSSGQIERETAGVCVKGEMSESQVAKIRGGNE